MRNPRLWPHRVTFAWYSFMVLYCSATSWSCFMSTTSSLQCGHVKYLYVTPSGVDASFSSICFPHLLHFFISHLLGYRNNFDSCSNDFIHANDSTVFVFFDEFHVVVPEPLYGPSFEYCLYHVWGYTSWCGSDESMSFDHDFILRDIL